MRKERKYYIENIVKAKRYLIASIVLALAGAVYEMFSHGIYSNHMIYAFMYPLAMGCLPYLADNRGIIKKAGHLSEVLLLAAIVTLSIGSVIRGVLEIYGTTNFLTGAYTLIGALLIIGAAAVCLINMRLAALSHKDSSALRASE